MNGMSYMELSDEEYIEMIECDKNDDNTGNKIYMYIVSNDDISCKLLFCNYKLYLTL